MNASDQCRLIVEQFTRQAVPFAEMPIHNDEETNRLVLEAMELGADDDVLDLACGPGLITCAAARIARSVTGIDLTPAMLEQARRTQAAQGLANLTWMIGDVESLPFRPSAFSRVMTRYSFHHFLNPQAVMAEMVRVCRPGGRIGVIDVYTTSGEQAAAYDRAEKLRDPSHVHALQLEEMAKLFAEGGLAEIRTSDYRLETGLEPLLTATGTAPDAADQLRRLFADDVERQGLGVATCRREGKLYFSFPIIIMTGMKPTSPADAGHAF